MIASKLDALGRDTLPKQSLHIVPRIDRKRYFNTH
jgi:hypothetical protein